ncbi:MAG TPA: tyrosine-protein phosphatase [Methylibium sp.]|nr:tyrosine-protein phosphatase [Methylibium sp.]
MPQPDSLAPPARARLTPLAGAVNFRELGGYRAADGRTVKWGRLHRSDSLAELTDEDVSRLRTLGLRSLVDLRHASERRHKPNRFGLHGEPRTHAIGFFPHGSEALLAGVRQRTLSEAAAHALLIEIYRQLPVVHAADFARLLKLLLLPDALPALVHCTSGKDRTGFGIAAVLLALDVPRETILEDYLLTNRYRRDLSFIVGTAVDPGVLDRVKAAHPDFLQAAFDAIDGHWGGTEAFLRRGLGLTAEQQTRLQELLLEAGQPAPAGRDG